MMGDITERKAEDIASGALNYNQVKALATGDPIIQEKAQVEQQLRQLLLLKRAWEDQQTHRHWERQSLYQRMKDLPILLNQLKMDLTTTQAHPITGDQFTCTIQGKVYTDRKKAGAALWRVNDFDFGGEFAGLRISRIRVKNQEYRPLLQGVGRYEFDIQETPLGTTMAMQTIVTKRIAEQIVEVEANLRTTQARVSNFGPMPSFTDDAKITALQQRLNEINDLLNRPEEAPPAPETPEEDSATEEVCEPDQLLEEADPEEHEISPQLVTALKTRTKRAEWL